MSSQLQSILSYIGIASGAGILGGILASLWLPGVNARSAVQHFAAGVVNRSRSLRTDSRGRKNRYVRRHSWRLRCRRTEHDWPQVACPQVRERRKKKHKLPIGLAAAAAIDTLIDGAIIATGFATGQQARRSTGPCHGGRTVLPHTIGRVRIS